MPAHTDGILAVLSIDGPPRPSHPHPLARTATPESWGGSFHFWGRRARIGSAPEDANELLGRKTRCRPLHVLDTARTVRLATGLAL